jgi:hypothetical protein
VPANSRILTADNLDTDGQTVDKTILLKFFFKADYTDLNTPDLVVSALDSAGTIIPAFKMVDAFGQILPDGNVSYNLNTNYAECFLSSMYLQNYFQKPQKTQKFNFFLPNRFQYCYFTVRNAANGRTSVEDTTRTIFTIMFEEAEDHTARTFEIDNESSIRHRAKVPA